MNSGDDEILESFIAECYEHLERVEEVLPRLKDADFIEPINVVFRMFHSIKSTSEYLGFKNIKEITHLSESFLHIYRKEITVPHEDDISLISHIIDIIYILINSVENSKTDNIEPHVKSNIVNLINNRLSFITELDNKQKYKSRNVRTDDFNREVHTESLYVNIEVT